MSRISNTAKKFDNELEVDVTNNTQATVETTNEIALSREKIEEILNRGLSVFWSAEKLTEFFKKLTEKEILGLHAYLEHKIHSKPDYITVNEDCLFELTFYHVEKIKKKIEQEIEQNKIKTSLETFFEKIEEDMDINTLRELHKLLSDMTSIYSDIDSKFKKQTNILSTAIEKLIDKKEKFEKIFQTSKGSTYFQIKTGETFRIKNWGDEYSGDLLGIEKIMKKTFFLAQEEVEKERKEEEKKRIKEMREGKGINIISYDFLLDKPLTKADYAIGSVVFEINIDSKSPAMKAEISDNSVQISLIANTPAMHLGHEITKIIK